MNSHLYAGGTTTGVVKMTLFLLCISHLYMHGVNGLRCFSCMSMDCPSTEEDLNCNRLRALVQLEMRSFYFIGNITASCPPLNDTESWQLLQVQNASTCPEPESSCSVGRIQLKVTNFNENDTVTGFHYSYATVLGCANPNSIQRDNYKPVSLCDNIQRTQTFCETTLSKRTIDLKHCRDQAKVCNETDFCVDAKESVVKQQVRALHGPVSATLLVIGMLTLLGIGVGIVAVGLACSRPRVMHAGHHSTLPMEDYYGGFQVEGLNEQVSAVAKAE